MIYFIDYFDRQNQLVEDFLFCYYYYFSCFYLHINPTKQCSAFPSSAKEKVSYFAVYDGHGGAQIADLCEKMVHKNIITDESFAKGDFETAIKNGFANTDKDLLKAAADANWHSGACVVSTIISKRKLWLGNLGDSEAILARREGTGYKAIELSHKHKPTDPIEKERIKKVGGYVVLGRVMGSLAVARALGDKDFKKPFNNSEGDYVSAEPHLNQIDLTPEDEFLIVSCDGLWYVNDIKRGREGERTEEKW